jgi:outer membrane protein
MMILPLGAFAQDVKIAFVKTQEVIMAMPEVSAMDYTIFKKIIFIKY